MRTTFVITAILAQILALAWMAGQREWIVATGPTVWLRTAPVDPRDMFRGDYVTLAYDISTIPADKIGPALKAELDALNEHEGRRRSLNREIELYVQLEADPESDVARIGQADSVPPASGLFVKGRVRAYRGQGQGGLTGVRYGIDAFFVEQGTGRELERGAPEGTPENIRVPLEMQVALGQDGTAVLTGHRWSALGVGLAIHKDTAKGEGASETGHPVRLELSYHNASPAPLAVVLPRDLRTLRLMVMDFDDPGQEAGPQAEDVSPYSDDDVRVLQPGETATVELNLNDPRWMVQIRGKKTLPLWHKDLNVRTFRLVYQTPPPEACTGLAQAPLIWRGQLPSREFRTYELRQE